MSGIIVDLFALIQVKYFSLHVNIINVTVEEIFERKSLLRKQK